jgi:hypothetical protein
VTFHRSIQNGGDILMPARRIARSGAALAAVLLTLAGCEGGNRFVTNTQTPGPGGENPTAPVAADTVRPTITIELPKDSANIAARDSVFVKAHVTDNYRVASVTLEGFAVRGDSILGTLDTVARFQKKTVDLLQRGVVRRDSVLRFLTATADTTPARRVRIVATARDSAGNSRSATVFINIGGPRVQITVPNDTPRAGTRLPVRIQAEDAVDRVRSVLVRVTGSTVQDVNVALATPRAALDTTILVQLSGTAGPARVDATVTSGSLLTSSAPPVTVNVLPQTADQLAPLVTFDINAAARMQATDTVVVPVQGTDDTRVDTVGATLRIRYRDPVTGAAVERLLSARSAGAAGSLRFPLAQLNLPPTDTLTLAVEATGWATDPAGNCGAAVTPNTPQRLACGNVGGLRVAAGLDGRLVLVLIVRGQTISLRGAGDTIADIVSNGRQLFASNIAANRVEVLPVAGTAFSGSVGVGSKPWGLALNLTGDSLYVANSGGTNISVVGIPSSGSPVEVRRIRTADLELYDVSIDLLTDEATSVVALRYSDRPQFLGHLTSGQILYSTRPTAAAGAGTVRIYTPSRDTSYTFGRGTEIFTGYAERGNSKAIVVNADSAFRTTRNDLVVYPRPLRTGDPTPGRIVGRVTTVRDSLTRLRAAGLTDTRVDYQLDGTSLGLSDTTFVATSTNHRAIAFGEGVRSFGRVLYFRLDASNDLIGSNRNSSDLVQNASERVIGLGLNADGSLGVARGNGVYFFDSQLRLAGSLASGSPSGGSTVHPLNAGYPGNDGRRVAFSSGVDASGGAYIDIINTVQFSSTRRLPIRDRVIGALLAVPVEAGDVDAGRYVLRLFAVTPTGVLRIGVTAADLQ